MANITITIPDSLVSDAKMALQRLYGDKVVGLSNRDQLAYHLRVTLGAHIKAIRQARIDRSALEASVADAEQQSLLMQTAIKTQETAVLALAANEIGGIL